MRFGARAGDLSMREAPRSQNLSRNLACEPGIHPTLDDPARQTSVFTDGDPARQTLALRLQEERGRARIFTTPRAKPW